MILLLLLEIVLIIKLRPVSHYRAYELALEPINLGFRQKKNERKLKKLQKQKAVSKITPLYVCIQQANNHLCPESVRGRGVNIACD